MDDVRRDMPRTNRSRVNASKILTRQTSSGTIGLALSAGLKFAMGASAVPPALGHRLPHPALKRWANLRRPLRGLSR